MADDPPERQARSRRRRLWTIAGTAASALAVAALTAVGSGLGSAVVDWVDGDEALVSASSQRQVLECGTPVFLREPLAGDLAAGTTAAPEHWPTFAAQTGAAVAGNDVVEVSIQGESSRTITLTGIDVEAERAVRPDGAVFTNPCGDATRGRAVRFDLDRSPPRIVASVADEEGVLPLTDIPGQRSPEALELPWTVSVTDPLLLKIVATTRTCLCTWRASITWRSGGESGSIDVDNDGEGYVLAGARGLPRYVRSGSTASGWAVSQASDVPR